MVYIAEKRDYDRRCRFCHLSSMAAKIPDDRELLEGIGLSFAEAALLCEALRALWLSPKVIERTWLEMRDIIETEHLDKKMGHDCICSAGADRRSVASAGGQPCFFRWVYFLVDGSASVSVAVQGRRERGTLRSVL